MPSTNLHVPLFQIALAKRADKVYPVPGPWINGGVIKSLSNIEAGTKPPGSADCEDNDGLAISLPCALSSKSNSQEGLPLQVGYWGNVDLFNSFWGSLIYIAELFVTIGRCQSKSTFWFHPDGKFANYLSNGCRPLASAAGDLEESSRRGGKTYSGSFGQDERCSSWRGGK